MEGLGAAGEKLKSCESLPFQDLGSNRAYGDQAVEGFRVLTTHRENDTRLAIDIQKLVPLFVCLSGSYFNFSQERPYFQCVNDYIHKTFISILFWGGIYNVWQIYALD